MQPYRPSQSTPTEALAWLIRLRERAGSAREVAAQLGLAQQTFSSRETGRTRWHLVELAQFLDLVKATPEERLHVLDLASSRGRADLGEQAAGALESTGVGRTVSRLAG